MSIYEINLSPQHAHAVAFSLAFILDKLLGDPLWLPHPIVWFGKAISFFDKKLNKGKHRIAKGALTVIALVGIVWTAFSFISHFSYKIHLLFGMFVETTFIFYALAGTTLIKEGKAVFQKLSESIEAGRRQVARIVGRDTAQLSPQQIRAATLETLAENLSDGVVAPMFWYALAGVPGAMAYKMVNTLDSMIGYKSEKYLYFGRIAARLDDLLNFFPARITAFFMAMVMLSKKAFVFLFKYGKAHSSPNAGYPEAALAGILDAQFGGSHEYFGKTMYKPLIGENKKKFTNIDLRQTIKTNKRVELAIFIIINWTIFTTTFAGSPFFPH